MNNDNYWDDSNEEQQADYYRDETVDPDEWKDIVNDPVHSRHLIPLERNQHPLGRIQKSASEAKEYLPNLQLNEKPDIPEDLFVLPAFDDSITWQWQRIRVLGTAPDKQRLHEEKLPPEFSAAANQLAARRQAFVLSCVGNANGSASFSIGMPKGEGGCAEDLLRAAFGVAELEPASAELTNDMPRWKQAVCEPVRLDTETFDKMELSLEPSRWADLAASVVCGADCAVQVAFYPTDNRIADMLERAYKTDDELTHYLKDTVQGSSNYGINSSTGLNTKPLVGVFWRKNIEEKLIRDEPLKDTRVSGTTSNIGYGYSIAQTLSSNTETRDFAMEQFQKKLRNRIRLLEQMQVLNNGWIVRISVHASEDVIDAHAAKSVCNALGGALLKIGYTCTWEKDSGYGIEKKNSLMLPGYLLPSLISFPQKSFIGFEAKPRAKLNLNPPLPDLKESQILGDASVPLGNLVWDGKKTNQVVRIPMKDINRHIFVCGKTGSGKSNTVTGFLSAMKNDLHCLVIEPVKGEYHALDGMTRYSMIAGDPECLQMNPFWFPEGSNLQYHIDSLKLIISSAFDLYAAMPNILEQCLYRVYVNSGWDVVSRKNIYNGLLPEEELYPTFRSLCDEIEKYLDESDFSDETRSNYEGALLSRLQSFSSGVKGLLLNTTRHIPVQEWAQKNVVVELDALADDSDKAIVMGALLIQYFEYVKYCTEHKGDEGLKHIFVLEEAHHLFKEKGAAPSASGEGSDISSSAHLVEMLNNLLAEARGYGEGFIIIDQSPSSISSSVLKNTGVKIVHRVDFGDDVAILQKVLLLEENDRTTASLKVGHALVRYGDMSSPCEVEMPPCEQKEKASMGGRFESVSTTDTAYDRILSNREVMDELDVAVSRILHQLLAEPFVFGNSVVIQHLFEAFKAKTTLLISLKCGRDSLQALANEDYYPLILQTCVNHAAVDLFPGQFVLSKSIEMFVMRLVEILTYYRKKQKRITLVDNRNETIYMSISQNEMFQKDMNVLDNYRYNQIWNRMESYYSSLKSLSDPFVTLWCIRNDLRGDKMRSQVPYFPVLRKLLLDEQDQLRKYDIVQRANGDSCEFTQESDAQFQEYLQAIIASPSPTTERTLKDYVLDWAKKDAQIAY